MKRFLGVLLGVSMLAALLPGVALASTPFVTGTQASPTGATTATISGAIDPNGESTTWTVQYDVASSDWCTSGGSSGTPASTTGSQSLGFSDSTFHSVNANLTGLTAGTSYCADLVATNGSGTADGGQTTFTPGTPQASTFDATPTGATTETISGMVNPVGQTTTYKVEYDVSSSTWCSTFGSSGTPASSTTPQTLGFTDSSSHFVSVNLTGLTAGAGYCADLVATNAAGTGDGGQIPFTAGAPSATTQTATPTGASTATVGGTVNPSGQTTTYKVEYDVSSSTWCSTFGSSGTPANSTTPQTLGFTDSTSHDVSVNLTGLTGGTRYCVAIAATNSGGTATGSVVSFTAGTPTATTDGVASTGASTATIDGSVNPTGQTTTYKVEYDTAASTWCTSSGSSGAPANSTTPQTLGFTDTSSHNVTVDLTGLTGGTSYCAELVATNPSGTAGQFQLTFTAGVPVAQTRAATATGASTATINGAVNPVGQTTTYKLQYDVASSTWCTNLGRSGSPAGSTTPQTLGFTDTTLHSVSIDVTGLTPGTTYCGRVVANNASGEGDGFIGQFTAGVPSASTDDASSTGATTATVDGTVNPAGQTTTYKVQYDTESSTWCSSFGSSGTPANSTTPQTLGFTDSSGHSVSVNLTGLTAGTSYCAAVVATNASGTATGQPLTFTAGAPLASTDTVTPGGTTATVNGIVNPSGQTTTYKVEYDLASSLWCSSGGSAGSSAHATTPQTLGFTDSTFHGVNVDLSGLTAGTAYCADLVATNPSGTADGGQVSFTTGVPDVSTDGVAPTGATTANVTGHVNPEGQTTTYKVEYDLASSDWCSSSGFAGSPANSTTPQTLGFTDSTSHAVTVGLTGLAAGTSYCVDLVATNAAGTGDGGQVSYAAPVAPTATTGSASSVGSNGATVAGSVNPNGSATTYHFEYGTSTSYGSSTSSQSAGSSSIAQSVSAPLTGLSPGTTYHYRLVATNAAGTTNGADQTFTTSAATVAPSVTTGSASGVDTGGATIAGSVNPNGSATTYHFEYGTSTSYGSSTSSQDAGSGSSGQSVSATLSGLSAGTTYHYRLVATNSGGTTNGADQTFTTSTPPPPPPDATTGSASGIGSTGATVAGSVNPNGVATSYHFEYGTSTSYGSSTSSQDAGSGSSAEPVSATLSGLAASTTYHYRLVATSSAGTTNGADQTFTTAAASPPPVRLTVSGVSLASTSFSEKVGSTLRFTLSKTATITVTVTGSVKGHKVKGVCKTTAKKGPPCSAPIKKTLSFSGSSGANSRKFAPVGLAPGRYSASLVARDSGGAQAGPVNFSFTIKK